jgi:adenine-specific DNA-methyltransferase
MEADVLERVEFLRLDANRGLNGKRKSALGQFMTPAPVSRLMASLLKGRDEIRLLDAGAGVGSLFASVVAEMAARDVRPKAIGVTAYEIDRHLAAYLPETISLCHSTCEAAGIRFVADIIELDFMADAAEQLAEGLFPGTAKLFNAAILNPPYKKINIDSNARRFARAVGVETSNIYTGFLAAAVRLLEPDGELVAITPRSFCNGSYFRGFREFFLREVSLCDLHVFESRRQAFSDDEVLQENLILRAVRKRKASRQGSGRVTITSSSGPDDELPLSREIDYDDVVRPGDKEFFIHVAADDLSQHVVDRMSHFRCGLADLGLTVSTGRVVDFRVKAHLRDQPGNGTAPLVWPSHFDKGYIAWPRDGAKKPESILNSEAVKSQLLPNEPYVLVRRFSAKEERKRVVAAVYDPDRVETDVVGFENHLNYFHQNGRGLDIDLARGLAAFLNSTIVDSYVRQFNGHTQVNATDLRSLQYPETEQLRGIGRRIGAEFPGQAEVDALISAELDMSEDGGIDPVRARRKIEESLEVLRMLGFPRQQLNERSALILLALLGIKADLTWADAASPLCGITPMMDFLRDHYGKAYRPNTRETVRKQTVHQFLDAGLIIANPDQPERSVNSPKAVYQIETSALKLLRAYGTKTWDKDLATYLSTVQTLKTKYAQERKMSRIPVTLAPGREITLSPGGQNVLVKEIIDQFAPRFTSPGVFIYVGDAEEKFAFFDEAGLAALGVQLDGHGKMPDVIVHYTEKNWLVLIEAVTSHGPIDPKRKAELTTLFGDSSAGLVFVTAFLTRKAMMKYIERISWETEVWTAENPTHMIHFNGKRFLGPYPV